MSTDDIKNALALLIKERREGMQPRAGSLYGLLRYRLDKVGVDQKDDPEVREMLQYSRGELSDFVNRGLPDDKAVDS